jgi:hypothetical protein
MTPYESFFPYILPEVPGAPEPVVLMAIRNSCIEFCERSLILTRDHDPISLIPKVIDYDLDPPISETVIIKVQRAFVEGSPINALAPDHIHIPAIYNRAYEDYEENPSTPQYYLQKDERSITVWPVPDKRYRNGLTMRVAMKPTRSSESVDDVIFEEYAEVIASGALQRLMSSAGKPYSNIQMAAVNKMMFDRGVNNAKLRMNAGHTRAALSVKMRRI